MTGEATPGYLYCSTCPTYILKYIPKVKFLFTLRSPLPRAYSEYLNKVADQLTLTLALALALALSLILTLSLTPTLALTPNAGFASGLLYRRRPTTAFASLITSSDP